MRSALRRQAPASVSSPIAVGSIERCAGSPAEPSRRIASIVVATVCSTSRGSPTYSPTEEELGVDALALVQALRCRHGRLGPRRHPAGDLLLEAGLLDPLVELADLLLGEVAVEAGEELVLHRPEVAPEEADQGGEVPAAPQVVVHPAAEAGLVVEDARHLALQPVAVVVEPAHEARVDPRHARGLGIERRALGPQVGQHHVLEVAGHPGERRQPLSRVMALAQQVVELGDERDAAAQPVVEVAEVVGRDHQRGVGAPCPRRARMAREVRVERGQPLLTIGSPSQGPPPPTRVQAHRVAGTGVSAVALRTRPAPPRGRPRRRPLRPARGRG